MSLAIINSRASVGTDAPVVKVEVHLSRGLPRCLVVGLAATAVKESVDRVRSALMNAGYEFPRQRITVNLAPADLPKEGGRFDLPIAIGILVASGQISCQDLDSMVFLGELALDGAVRPIKGALIAALSVRGTNQFLILPAESARQAAIVNGTRLLQAETLTQVGAALNGQGALSKPELVQAMSGTAAPDFSDVIGHLFAKHSLEVAAAGQHSVFMTGPPGSGKTMLASRIGGILPEMTESEALQVAAIASVSKQGFNPDNWRRRPFRSPHHSASGAAIIGGGSIPAPGEVSLAHLGVLFLDELPEFQRGVLESLREPMEAGEVYISRAARQARFLARFLLVAAANPCPCGYLGDPDRCHCVPEQIGRYRNRLSGPLLDRIDMHVNVQAISASAMLAGESTQEASATIRRRVEQARRRQIARQGVPNAELDAAGIGKYCRLTTDQTDLLVDVVERSGLSTRGCHRVLKLARSVADLADHNAIDDDDLLQAVKLRGANQREAEHRY